LTLRQDDIRLGCQAESWRDALDQAAGSLRDAGLPSLLVTHDREGAGGRVIELSQ
jgi:ABC-type uncharacterized transport system YnjBCD ATPase subunit